MLQKLCKIYWLNTKQKEYSKQEGTRIRQPRGNLKFRSFLNSFLADILIFTAALITDYNTGYNICDVQAV